MPADIKRVGQSGQISIGRDLAGKLLRLEQLGDGRMLLTPVVDIPESQVWTLSEPHKSRIQQGLEWAAQTPPRETNVSTLLERVRAQPAKVPKPGRKPKPPRGKKT